MYTYMCTCVHMYMYVHMYIQAIYVSIPPPSPPLGYHMAVCGSMAFPMLCIYMYVHRAGSQEVYTHAHNLEHSTGLSV